MSFHLLFVTVCLHLLQFPADLANHCGANSDSPVMFSRHLMFAADLLHLHLRLFWISCAVGHVVVAAQFWETSISGRSKGGTSLEPISSWDLLDTVDDLALFQHVCEPARVVASQSSILDPVLSARLSDIEYIDCLSLLGTGDRSKLMVR